MTALIPFTPLLAERICDELREGATLLQIANGLGVSRPTVYKWLRLYPLFADAYGKARAEGTHALIDEALLIADSVKDPQRARNMIGARQWAAERRNRKEYGQAVDVTLTERVDLGGTLIEARKRTALPACDQAQSAAAQVTDYLDLGMSETTDSLSVAPAVDPFAE